MTTTSDAEVTEASAHDDIASVVDAWLAHYTAAIDEGNRAAAPNLFVEDAWWRDLLVLDWDLRTHHGQEAVASTLARAGGALSQLRRTDRPVQLLGSLDFQYIEAFLEFGTPVGRGIGIVRLVRGDDEQWRAWTLLTALDELQDAPAGLGPGRPIGHPPFGSPAVAGVGWAEARRRTVDFEEADPEVIVIGGGQGGLALAAQLGVLGVTALIVERNPRIGDNWRNRYESLILHDPVWADHLPFLSFPPTWPIYTPKDKLGDWFEHYASSMELNVWTSSSVLESEYDDATGGWTVRIDRDGTERTLRPRHVVLATGALGLPSVPAIDGMTDFDGQAYHSSQHRDGGDWTGKKAIVVGACNSGHDIAQNLHLAGADVTMVQRSSTYVISQKHGIPAIFGSLYFEGGPALEEADLHNASYPPALGVEFAKGYTPVVAEQDRELLEGLEAVGFKLDTGIEGGGLMSKAYERGGGYYIDVGCSQLIVDGKIAIAQGSGVQRFLPQGIELEDGRVLEADLVVLATGYQNMRETARAVLGSAVADRCQEVWGLDGEGELRTIWRPSGHPKFWFMGGPLATARIYSKFLAIQIKAEMLGLKGGNA